MGFAKGNEALRDQIQKALEELADEGTLAQISEKWFQKDITTINQ
nr:transporter substrate-binding domain-containing protein [Suipraeoptans intestinalis]